MLKNRYALFITTLFCCFFMATSFAAFNPLPADQAFVVSASVNNANQVSADFRIAPGYYLYADKVKVTLDPNVAADIRYPRGTQKDSPVRGKFFAYSGNISIPVLLKSPLQQINLTIAYQGCSKAGYCYPPTQKTIALTLPMGVSVSSQSASLSTLLTDQYSVRILLSTQHFGVMLLMFFGLGVLLAFTPCVFPMIPILVAIIAGQKTLVPHRKRTFFLSITYVLGMAVTYALAGLAAAYFGANLQILLQKPIFIVIGAFLFVLLALTLFEFYDLPFGKQLRNFAMTLSKNHQGGNYLHVFMMAMVSTLIISPCVTAPLVGVLMYIAQTGDMLLGGSALFVMGIGMGLPLLVVGMSAGSYLPRSGVWMQVLMKLIGILMLAMAIWLLARILPHYAVVALWGVFFIGVALLLGFYFPRLMGKPLVNRVLGLVAGLTGVIFLFSSVGIFSFARWEQANPANSASMFMVVRDMQQLNAALAKAQEQHLPVLLDFYADWCESCVVMERNVFAKKNVQIELKNYMLVRADLTDNSAADEAMMKAFNIVAPPTVLFFNVAGKEVNSRRIVGAVNVNEFLSRLNLFMAQSCDKKEQC